MDFSSRGDSIGNTHSGAQLPVTPDPQDPMPSSGFYRHMVHRNTCKQEIYDAEFFENP